jgi:polar amino acid transport system permease protein
MTAPVGSTRKGASRPPRPEILEQIDAAQRRARLWFRVQFALVWIGLVGGLGYLLWRTGNIDLGFIGEWGPFILGGVGYTVLVCVLSIFFATIIALIGAVARLSSNAIIFSVASLYVSLVRGTPLLVQIFFVYFALPQLGVVLDAVPAGVIALSFNYGAYMTEIFRAGIQAVPGGQREAAQALGMPERLVMRRVVMPQAVRIVIPAIGNEFIAMIKDSALVSIIAVRELLWRARRVGTQNFRTLEAFLMAALVYWVLTIIFSSFQERLERRMARGDR